MAVDAEGTFYILANQLGCSPDVPQNRSQGFCNLQNQVVVSRSVDGGRTWSEPVETPLGLSGAPKLRVDITTGKVYAVGGMEFQYPSGVSVSADGGQTWGPARLIPGPLTSCISVSGADRCGYPGREIAVHDGIVASVSQDVPVPPTPPTTPPSGVVTFHVSRNDFQTWQDRTVTDSDGNAVPAGTGLLVPFPAQGRGADPVPWVSADPTSSGRFAVMVPRAPTWTNLEVYVTNDAGVTWTGPTVIAAPNARRPWIDFGSKGAWSHVENHRGGRVRHRLVRPWTFLQARRCGSTRRLSRWIPPVLPVTAGRSSPWTAVTRTSLGPTAGGRCPLANRSSTVSSAECR